MRWRAREKTVRNMRWFEVTETRGHIENGKVDHWQVTSRSASRWIRNPLKGRDCPAFLGTPHWALVRPLRLRGLIDLGRAVHQDRWFKGDKSQARHSAENSPNRQSIENKTSGQRITQCPRWILADVIFCLSKQVLELIFSVLKAAFRNVFRVTGRLFVHVTLFSDAEVCLRVENTSTLAKR